MRRNNLTKLDVQLKTKSKTQLKTKNTSIETSFEDMSFQNTNMRMDNQPLEPLMLTDGNSVKYGNLVTIEKTKKEKPKRLKVNPEGMKQCIILFSGILFIFIPILLTPLFEEMAEVSETKVMSERTNITSSFSMVIGFLGFALAISQVFKILTALVRGEPIELTPFEWEYKTVEEETITDFYCKSPKELYESEKNNQKDPNKSISMGVIYKK